MPIVIDGLNLIYKFPDLEERMYRGQLEEAREGLLQKLKDYQRITHHQIRVVFDGRKKPSHNTRSEKSGSIDVYYSLEYSADFLIKEFIKKDPNPRMSTVVTSDKDIQFFVNRFKAKILTSEKFADSVVKVIEESLAIKAPEKEENPQVSEDEITFWERLFRTRP